MKMKIKSIPKPIAVIYLLTSAYLIYLILFTFYHQGYLLMLICIAILLLEGGYFLYAYTTSANFLIDEQGMIQAVMPKVKPDTNAAQILELLNQ